MKFTIKHAMVLLLVGFLIGAPLSAAANPSMIVAQDDFNFESLLESLLTDGAEVIFANVDDQGVPGVIYGQLGIPSSSLGLENPMYDGCIAMALVSTHGEFLDMVFDLLASGGLDGGDGGDGGFALAQDGGFDVNSILDMLGTEFNLLINVFVNVDEATSNSRMTSIMSHLTSTFGFSFVNLLNLRIDESLFPEDADFELPFDSIDIFIQQVTQEFGDAVNTMLNLMNGDGFLDAIDRTKFTEAAASAAGLLAIPDMGEVIELIESFSGNDTGGGDFLPAAVYSLAQTPFDFIDGPIAVAAAGYVGDQLLDTSSSSIHIEELVGVTGTISPLPDANSLIIAKLPENVNVTSISPDVPDQSFYDNESNVVYWNATALGTQSDYIISFEPGAFPPMISIERTFSPLSGTIGPGGSTTVTVTVTNEGDESISNLVVSDTGFATTYTTVTVTGTTSNTFATLGAGESATISYTVTFANEGGYTFAPAEITYDYDGDSYFKDSLRHGFIVATDLGGLLTQAILDGMPYSGIFLGVVGLVGIYAIMGLRKGSSSVYQV